MGLWSDRSSGWRKYLGLSYLSLVPAMGMRDIFLFPSRVDISQYETAAILDCGIVFNISGIPAAASTPGIYSTFQRSGIIARFVLVYVEGHRAISP